MLTPDHKSKVSKLSALPTVHWITVSRSTQVTVHCMHTVIEKLQLLKTFRNKFADAIESFFISSKFGIDQCRNGRVMSLNADGQTDGFQLYIVDIRRRRWNTEVGF